MANISCRCFLHLIVVYLCLVGTRTKAQQIITSETDTFPPIPPDSFLEDEEPEHNYPNVVTIKFHLKDETLAEYFTKLALQETGCPVAGCNISLIDIANSLQLSRISSVDLAEAIARLNVRPIDFYNIFLLYDVNASSIEDLLYKCGLSFSEVYNNFVGTLLNPSGTIQEILGVLGVSVMDFMNAQTYGNDSIKLQVLFTGNYSQANIQTVFSIINQTVVDLLKTIPLNTVAARLNNFNAVAFDNFVKNLGITSISLNNLYQHLNITVVHFLANSQFIKLVTDHYEFLNPEEVLGVIVSNKTVVTTNTAKSLTTFQTQNTDLVRNYTRYVVERVENQLVQYPVKNVILRTPEYVSQTIAIVGIFNSSVNSTEISGVYNSTTLNNCTYISKLPFGGIWEENITSVVLNNHEITLPKSSQTIYNLGSPLYCQGKLYGIATEDNGQTIKFATFLKRTPGTTTPTGQHSTIATEHVTTPNVVTISEPSSGTIVSQSLIYFIVTVIFVGFVV